MEFVKRDVFELDHTSILVSKHKILLGIIAYVFAPSGRIFETHPYPGPAPTNCCFGGTEMKTVYVTGFDGSLWRTRTDRAGFPIPPT